MTDRRIIRYGGVPVPYTVSWSAEDGNWRLDRCAHAGRLAVMQREARGEGKPRFGKPHSQRQREVIALGLCDLCGKPLAGRTKVSLSHARVVPHGASGPCVMQVEPLLHRECALVSMMHCPSLKRDIQEGSLKIRQVTRHQVQMAMMSAEYMAEITGDARIAVGHGKVVLLAWKNRDEAWLRA